MTISSANENYALNYGVSAQNKKRAAKLAALPVVRLIIAWFGRQVIY